MIIVSHFAVGIIVTLDEFIKRIHKCSLDIHANVCVNITEQIDNVASLQQTRSINKNVFSKSQCTQNKLLQQQ